MAGGFSYKEVDNDSIEAANSVKEKVEGMLNGKLDIYNVTEVSYQIVEGINYNLTINIGKNKFITIGVLKHLPHNGGGYELLNLNQETSIDSKDE